MQLVTDENKEINHRLINNEAIDLYKNADLLELGKLANDMKRKYHSENEPVTFIIDRNVNYTNVCTAACRFCAFAYWPGDKRTYTNSYEVIFEKTKELVDLGGTQLLLQGGHNPELKIEYYEDLFKRLRNDFPSVTLHALSPSEIDHICNVSNLDTETVIKRLRDAGLNSIPGGGAEILVDRVRNIISPLKINSDRWLEVMEVAHRLGMKTTATMMYGHVETLEERIEHMEKIRNLQDKYNGFTAFISWPFQKENNALGDDLAKDAVSKDVACNVSTDLEYLRTLAISRIFIDNIPNFQSSWVTMGIHIGQLALAFGANDMGGTMLEENVVSAAGKLCNASMKDIINAIHGAGKDAAQRDTGYKTIKIFSKK